MGGFAARGLSPLEKCAGVAGSLPEYHRAASGRIAERSSGIDRAHGRSGGAEFFLCYELPGAVAGAVVAAAAARNCSGIANWRAEGIRALRSARVGGSGLRGVERRQRRAPTFRSIRRPDYASGGAHRLSGIVGIYERSGAPVDRGLLQALAHFLSFRGPDGRETWSQGAIGLGHTMLRTTRESQIEQQPASLDGKLWITADARIDCREELEKNLAQQGQGAAGRTATDSGLILCAYAAWGADCVQHLRGDFAFAIWDARKKLLFCARDHFGVKPFYYAEPGELFLFSNTLDCLRQHPDVSERLNDAAIGDFLLFGLNCDVATTTFRDIRRLPAAHVMTISSEGLHIQRYWSAPTEGRIRYNRMEDYVEHFQILLQAAVADRTRVDRAGILLSGGLDSATIAATARELAGGTLDLRAYTVVYESLIPDEDGEHARCVAEFLKIPQRCIPMDALQPFERWNEPETMSPEPVDDPYFAGHRF